MPAKKTRGVIAKTRKKLGLKPRAANKPKTKKRTGVAGGYSNPNPRKRLMDEAGNIRQKKKKK